MVLASLISNFFTNKTSLANKWMSSSSSNLALVSLIYNDFACIAFQLFFHVFPTTSGAFLATTSNNFQGSFHFAIKNRPSFVSVLLLSLLPWSHLIQYFLLGLSKYLKTFGHEYFGKYQISRCQKNCYEVSWISNSEISRLNSI